MTFIRMAPYTIQQRIQIVELSFKNVPGGVVSVNTDRLFN